MRTATLVVVILWFVPQFVWADVITAEHVTSATNAMGGFSSGGDFILGQSFTTTFGGVVSRIAVDVYSQNSELAPVTISVWDTAIGGEPGSILGSADIPAQEMLLGNLYEADFSSSGVVLAPDTLYAFTLSTPARAPVAGFAVLGSAGLYSGGIYWSSSNGGSTWSSNSSRDIHFRASVNAIPEPSSLALMCLGGVAFFAFCRRRRRQHVR